MLINRLSDIKQHITAKIEADDIVIKDYFVTKSLDPICIFKLARKIKKCHLLHVSIKKSLFPYNSLLGIYYFLFYFTIKFPKGPLIITSVYPFKRSIIKNFFRHLFLIIPKLFSDFYIPETKYMSPDFGNIYLSAYFSVDCGHPDSIYKSNLQRGRINWLKKNSYGNILEVGCATGYILNYLGGGTGVDIDKRRIKFARKKYPKCTFLLQDVTKTDFKDKEFDTVIIPDILEHVPFEIVPKIIKECERIGKKILITVPNAGKKNYNKNLIENPEHLWYPTKTIMRKLVGEKSTIEFSKKDDFIYVIKLS